MNYPWHASILAFFDRRILAIFFLGFSSGLPFLLTLSTLTIWLKELGVSNTTVGLFVMATFPYMFKFLWGPIVDQVKIPFLTPKLGQRRSWALLAQVALMGAIWGLGTSHPECNICATALWALAVAFCGAIQDVVIEAYRIEIIDKNQKGAAATAMSLGWRVGLLVSGVGALYLAEAASWPTAYATMVALMSIGVVTTLCSPTPLTLIFSSAPHLSLQVDAYQRLWNWISKTYLPPLRELWGTYDWRIVLAFIFFYKIGDTTLSVMNTPFLVETGFTKIEIANIAKFFGISTMVVGALMGGVFVNRFPILHALILCASLQLLASLMFVIQALVGHDLNMLIVTIGVEHFTSGFGATAFIAYLSSLCSAPHTATHFALLSSFGSMARIVISGASGMLADAVAWPGFFMLTATACVPCIALLLYASSKASFRAS